MTNVPYSRHSPRVTPQPTRKLLKHTKTPTSVSQDSDCGSPHNPDDHILHHSADSGFASTEVDQNHRLMLTIQRQMCVSEYEKSMKDNEKTQLSPIMSNEIAILVAEDCRKSSPPDKGTSGDSRINAESGSNISTLPPLTIQEAPHFGEERKRKTPDPIESINIKKGSYEEKDDSNIDNINSPSESTRPPSLSEVPLPPLSMLNDVVTWPMSPPAEFDDHQDNHPLPSPPNDFEQVKLTFRNSTKNRVVSAITSLF